MTPGILFAQEPTITTHEIGSVVLALMVVALFIERIKALFWSHPSTPKLPIPRLEEYIKRAELDELKAKLDNFVTRLEMQRLEQQLINLSNDHKDLAKTTAQKNDEMCKSINDIRVSIEQVRREIHVETNAAADRIINRILTQMHLHPHPDEEK
jgi:hypothetical protein